MKHVISKFNYGENELLEALVKNSNIQELLNIAAKITGNPFFFFDESNQLFASSDNLDFVSGVWKESSKKGFFSETELLKNLIIIDSDVDTPPDFPPVPTEKDIMIRSSLSINNKSIGFLATCDLIHTFSVDDIKFANYFNKIFLIRLGRDTFYRTTKGTKHESFFYNILKSSLDPDSIKLRQKVLNINLNGIYIVLVVDTSTINLTRTPLEVIQKELDQIINNSYSIIYNNRIVFIINTGNPLFVSGKTESRIAAYLDSKHLFGSISNPFTDISMLKNFYSQSVETNRIILFTKSGPGLYYYKNYILDYLLILGESTVSPINFIHPSIDILKNYDTLNSTNYLLSLQTYILSLGNMAESARLLDIHYNTMKYRIGVIQDIAHINLKDPATFVSVFISFRIYEGLE